MTRLKTWIAKWCRDAKATADRIVAGTCRQMDLPLEPAPDAYPVPDRYLESVVPCEDEPDDDDEPDETQQVTFEMTARSHSKRYDGGDHASTVIHPSRSWREPEPLERVVAEGRALRAKLRRTLRVPAEERLARYLADSARTRGLAKDEVAA